MNLRRGLFRLTLVAVAVGICCVLLTPKPSFDSFRWRLATQTEKQQAAEWSLSQTAPFDPDVITILENGNVLKPHQNALPFEFAAIYFVLPFIISALITCLLFAVILFVTQGFDG